MTGARDIRLEIHAEDEKNIAGELDAHLKTIERALSVSLLSRDGCLHIIGGEEQTSRAEQVLRELLRISRRGDVVTTQEVRYLCSLARESQDTNNL